jgi:hypothetical protein
MASKVEKTNYGTVGRADNVASKSKKELRRLIIEPADNGFMLMKEYSGDYDYITAGKNKSVHKTVDDLVTGIKSCLKGHK